MANSSKDQKWIQKAIKRPGAFKSSAEKAPTVRAVARTQLEPEVESIGRRQLEQVRD